MKQKQSIIYPESIKRLEAGRRVGLKTTKVLVCATVATAAVTLVTSLVEDYKFNKTKNH